MASGKHLPEAIALAYAYDQADGTARNHVLQVVHPEQDRWKRRGSETKCGLNRL
jgi:hypothetical protein